MEEALIEREYGANPAIAILRHGWDLSLFQLRYRQLPMQQER
jgi:hypothetical protein